MSFSLTCKCGATCSAEGSYDPDTNATELDDRRPMEWEGGDADCPHEDFEIGAEEIDDEPDHWRGLP